MHGGRSLVLILLGLVLAACPAQPSQSPPRGYAPPIGSNEVFRHGTAAAPGHELIVADLKLPPDSVGAPHYHPWEEFLYVIEGSAVLDLEGQEPRELRAGERFVIPGGAVHTPRAGPDGIRAIIIRVHNEGDPVMVPAGG